MGISRFEKQNKIKLRTKKKKGRNGNQIKQNVTNKTEQS